MTDNPQITETLRLNDLKTVSMCKGALATFDVYVNTLNLQQQALRRDDPAYDEKANTIATGRSNVRRLRLAVEARMAELRLTEQTDQPHQPLSLAGDILRALKKVDHEAYLQVIVALHPKYPNISRIA